MTFLSDGAAWLFDQLKTHAAVTVTYERGIDSVEWTAVVGRTEFDSRDDLDLVVTTESVDFLGQAADLVLGGAATLPQRGDKIKRTIDGTTHVYEVLPFGPDDRLFAFSDRSRKRLRVHTKYLGTA